MASAAAAGLHLSRDVDAIGFDLDHTVVRYHCANLSQLVHHSLIETASQTILNELGAHGRTSEYFSGSTGAVRTAGYSTADAARLTAVPFDYDLAKKGVIVDKQLGNLIQVDSAGRVTRAFHGLAWSAGACSRPLDESELDLAYGEARVAEGFTGGRDARYWSLHTHFESPAGPVFGALVALSDAAHPNGADFRQSAERYAACTEILYDAMATIFSTWTENSPYFSGIVADPDKYILHQEGLRDWLKLLGGERGLGSSKTADSSGKENPYLFLLTNSLPEYTDFIARFTLGDNWTELFGITGCIAQKPRWFYEWAPFREVHINAITTIPGEVSVLTDAPTRSKDLKVDSNATYAFGCAEELHNALRSYLHGPDHEFDLSVCYIGDHLRNDTSAAKKHLGWKTIGIVEELADLEFHRLEELHDVARAHHETDRAFLGCTNSNHQHLFNSALPWFGYFHCPHVKHGNQLSFWTREMASCDLFVPTLGRLAAFGPHIHFQSQHFASVNPFSLVDTEHTKRMADIPSMGEIPPINASNESTVCFRTALVTPNGSTSRSQGGDVPTASNRATTTQLAAKFEAWEKAQAKKKLIG